MLEQSDVYRVLRYLGWPIKLVDPDSSSYSGIITRTLRSFPDDAQDILFSLLTRLEQIDGQIQDMVGRSNIKAIDDIQFFEDSTGQLRKERSNVIREVASLMDMPIGPGVTNLGMGTVRC